MPAEQIQLFDIHLAGKKDPSFKNLQYPVWTEKKAKLIAKYLYYFVLITRHGTYIDGFSGPQKPDNPDTWAAKLVIENQPKWLRNIYLFEKNKGQYECILSLKNELPKDKARNIETFCGDFNLLVDKFFRDKPIKDREATFCLLDQRTFECHWATVKKIAKHKKKGYKIEIFYFLPIGWLDRSLSALKDVNVLEKWWGRNDWKDIFSLRPWDRALLFIKRFKEELDYEFVNPWPIFAKRGGGRIMYFMIHASDHFEAPKLMYRAYSEIVKDVDSHQQLAFEFQAQPNYQFGPYLKS